MNLLHESVKRGYDMLWLNKKVYLKIKNSNRSYSGKIIDENNLFITLIDIKNNQVQINKEDISIIQEEE